MIIIEEGWEHAIRVYISFLTTDTSFERHNGAKVSFKYDTSIPFFFKNPNWIFSVQWVFIWKSMVVINVRYYDVQYGIVFL